MNTTYTDRRPPYVLDRGRHGCWLSIRADADQEAIGDAEHAVQIGTFWRTLDAFEHPDTVRVQRGRMLLRLTTDPYPSVGPPVELAGPDWQPRHSHLWPAR